MSVIVAYVRVSTDKQDLENQRFEIKRFAKDQGFADLQWTEEVISGSKELANRQLGPVLERLDQGDVLIVSEISRISRRLLDIMEVLKFCIHRGVTIRTVKEGYVFGDDINSQVMAFAFGLAAEIERRLISARTKEALARKRAEGVQLGRPPGTYLPHHRKLHRHEAQIRELLTDEHLAPSSARLARKFGVNRQTMTRFIAERGLRPHQASLNGRINQID